MLKFFQAILFEPRINWVFRLTRIHECPVRDSRYQRKSLYPRKSVNLASNNIIKTHGGKIEIISHENGTIMPVKITKGN